MKSELMMLSVFASLAAAAAVPKISDVALTQDAASRDVTITYKLSGESAVVTLDIETNVTDEAGTRWVKVDAGALRAFSPESAVFRKVETNDLRTIVWSPDVSWPDTVIAAGGARAVLKAWPLDDTPDYLVIDLTAGGDTANHRYYPSEAHLPGGIMDPGHFTAKMVMRRVHARGKEFQMGNSCEPFGAGWGYANPKNAYSATLANDYYLAVFELTEGQYNVIVGQSNFANPRLPHGVGGAHRLRWNAYNDGSHGDGSGFIGGFWPNAPYATSLLGLARTRTGLDLDLPTEAEWEFAARAGHPQGSWGDGSAMIRDSNGIDQLDENLDKLAWYGVNGGGVCHEVGRKNPNSWGFYDIIGNMAEDVLDWGGYIENGWQTDDRASLHGAPNIDPTDGSKTRVSGKKGTLIPMKGGYWHPNSKLYEAMPGHAQNNPDRNAAETYEGVRFSCRAGLR